MRIWHVGASASPRAVDGVTVSAWEIARAQSRLGHDVWMLSDRPTDDAGRSECRATGVQTLHVHANQLRFNPRALDRLLQTQRPDVAHLHSVFVPRQNRLARRLRENAIPYVVTPNGGLSPAVLGRGRCKKIPYAFLFERPRISGAAAVTAVTAGEARHVRAFVPHYAGTIRVIPNPVSQEPMQAVRWLGPARPPRVVFLGRFDVLHKGLDRLVEISRHLPGVQFHLYGSPDRRTEPWLKRLRAGALANLVFHEPVFDHDKLQVLADCSMYVQMSRWEGFPLSIAEAMSVGTPCAVCETLDVAAVLAEGDRGLLLSENPALAAEQLAEALADESRLAAWSQASRHYAQSALCPRAVARQAIELYDQLLTRAAAQPQHGQPQAPASPRDIEMDGHVIG